MKTIMRRTGLCSIAVLLLVATPFSRAVDPVDFLESLKDDEEPSKEPYQSTEYPNGVNVIPGEAEVNYPVYSTIPKSSFSCIGRPVGFYADTDLRCQVWHICDEESRQQSFLCTNGTVYSQEKRVCDWWYNVNCDPNEVSKNYLQNYDLYKESPPKSQENRVQDENEPSNNENEYDFKSTTRRDPFNQPSSRQTPESQPRYNSNNNNQEQYSRPTPSYNEPAREQQSSNFANNYQPPTARRQPQPTPPTTPRTTSTTTYRSTTSYRTPPPPAALENSPFQNQRPQQRQQQQSTPPTAQTNNNAFQQQRPQQQRQQQQQSTPTNKPPAIQHKTQGGKRIVEIRVPVSQIPPEILSKYGKRIPEHILKEIFLNFTRGMQQQLQTEAINNKPSNPTGASGVTRSPPPTHSAPQNHPAPTSRKQPVNFGPGPNSPAATPQRSQGNSNPSPTQNSQGNSNQFSSQRSQGNSNPPPPPPPPPPQEPHLKFRHSTPRKVDNVKFATPTRELLAEYEDERQQVGESQNPIYSLQQLFTSHHSRTHGKSRPVSEVAKVKDDYTFAPTTTTTSTPSSSPQPQQFQEFTRSQPRRRTQTPSTTTTTEEPVLITDRYFPVATREEKKNAEIRRITLVAKAGIKVLPPIPVLPAEQTTPRRQPVTQRPPARTTTEAFSRVPPPPKVTVPDDYYVKNERFEEAESRYPRPPVPASYIEPRQEIQRRVTTTTTTTTTTTPAPTQYEEPDFRRNKPTKPQNRKKVLPPPETKKQDDSSDYDDTPQERGSTDELELLRLAQQYIELTGQDFGVRKQPRNA